jgi:lactate racemase
MNRRFLDKIKHFSYTNLTIQLPGRMKINLKYGKGSISCQIENILRFLQLEPPPSTSVSSVRDTLFSSVESPVGSVPLSDFVSYKSNILIVVPDKTRQCLLHTIVPILTRMLERIGIQKDKITILFANGTHTGQTEADARKLLGDFIVDTYKVVQHASKDESSLGYLGTTKRGTEIYLNKLVLDADRIITVGGILHHYFAGFGGGPKLLIPGTAGYSTARRNHSYTIDRTGKFNSECRDGVLTGNPVYEDIAEGVRMIDNIFSINLVINPLNQITNIVSGDCIESHREGSRLAGILFEVSIEQRADAVIVSCGGAPRDGTLIQSHKAIHHSFYAVRPGGVIIAAAACSDGIGSDTFMNWFDIPYDEMGHALLNSYSLNGHTALALRDKLRSTAIILVTDLPRETVLRTGLIPAKSLQYAVDRLTESFTDNSLLYCIPNGSLTIPIYSNNTNDRH